MLRALGCQGLAAALAVILALPALAQKPAERIAPRDLAAPADAGMRIAPKEAAVAAPALAASQPALRSATGVAPAPAPARSEAPAVVAPPLPPPSASGPVAPVATPAPPPVAAPTVLVAPAFNPVAPAPAALPSAPEETEFEPGQLLVLWNSADEAEQGIQYLLAEHRLRPRLRTSLATLGMVVALYQLPGDREALALQAKLRAAQPGWVTDRNARMFAAEGPRLYALQKLNIPATPAPAGLAAVRVGVIDGPTDADALLKFSKLQRRSVLMPADVPAGADHGNAIATLISGAPASSGFTGAAPGVELYWASALRLVGDRPSGHSLLTALALDWLLAQKVQVINISLGGRRDAVLAEVFRRMGTLPVLVLAAAGNGGPQAEPVYPAAYPGVLAVTALDAREQVYALANQGDYIALAAPGVDVWVPSADGSGRYVSGTSFATALASGAVARLLAGGLGGSKARQTEALCQAAKDLGASGRDTVFGCGLLRLP